MCYLGQKKIRALVSKKNFDGNPLNGLYPQKGEEEEERPKIDFFQKI